MAALEVKVPDIGDSKDVPVIDVLVKDGERVEKDAALIVLESEKATMEVPAPQAGVVRAIRVKVGDKVNTGTVICALEAAAGGETGSGKREAGGATARPDAARPAAAAAATQAPAPKVSSASSASRLPPPASQSVLVPDLGDYHDVPVIEVLVKDGDRVEKDGPLATLESEKATMELPAPAAGTVRNWRLKPGDKVSKGDAVCTLELDRDAPPQSMPQQPKPALDLGPKEEQQPPPRPAAQAIGAAAAKPVAEGVSPWAAQAGAPVPHASPGVRRLAREFGVDLARVAGSGPHGRIVADDVQSFVKNALTAGGKREAASAGIPAVPAIDFSQFGSVESKPLARIRKLSAAHLHRSWLNVPHVTQTDEADITELEAFRKSQNEESGTKLTLLPFLMKAVAAALKAYPEFNSSLSPDGESLILKQYCHIGFAADTENGLVVPVVRDVWSKGIAALGAECAALARKAREGKLKPEEMKGGCFSISSLGGIGGAHFTPIVNAPEVGILGVSRAQMKPVWDGKAFQPRLLCPLSLSYDHRVIDGAYAARFIVHLGRLLADLRRLAL